MARLIAALAALVLGWLSILTPSSAAVTLTSSPVATYGYDDHHSPAQFVDTNSERGPPAAHDRATTVYDARALLLSPDSAAAGARSSPSRSGAASWGRSASVRGDVVAADTADDVGGMIYRTGSRTDNALTDASGVSFRDSVSSSLSSQHPQIFRPGDKVWAVDTSRLPPGAVVRDGVPPGHVSVNATPGQIRDAIVDDPFLGGLGLKPLDELGSYRLPR